MTTGLFKRYWFPALIVFWFCVMLWEAGGVIGGILIAGLVAWFGRVVWQSELKSDRQADGKVA